MSSAIARHQPNHRFFISLQFTAIHGNDKLSLCCSFIAICSIFTSLKMINSLTMAKFVRRTGNSPRINTIDQRRKLLGSPSLSGKRTARETNCDVNVCETREILYFKYLVGNRRGDIKRQGQGNGEINALDELHRQAQRKRWGCNEAPIEHCWAFGGCWVA